MPDKSQLDFIREQINTFKEKKKELHSLISSKQQERVQASLDSFYNVAEEDEEPDDMAERERLENKAVDVVDKMEKELDMISQNLLAMVEKETNENPS